MADDKKKPVTKTETEVVEWLKYRFNDEELKEHSMEMAQSTIRANEAEEKKKAVNAGFKDTIERHQLTARTASRFISTGYEMRDIPCIKAIDYQKNTVTITRKDTGEVVIERKIKDSERQMSL